MNEPAHEPQPLHDVIEQLTAYATVPHEVLWRAVTDQGACMDPHGDEPAWSTFTGEPDADRALAAAICAGCPVRLPCLEVELRTTGGTTTGVWGALSEHDRREVYPHWRENREGNGDAG
ncbi:WhiB family transcriptional regulator [Actinoalloteichus spitiensis]|uniref:WhiB family transcriptional regulator n=1 Tax=Actinoalloteichus spitiensis TaxID=252394 RepID=UPI001FE060CA|nr:WhiB family transcriptional regulator [Actinoalloteichus spitiensis]